jgi:hypothetical protein
VSRASADDLAARLRGLEQAVDRLRGMKLDWRKNPGAIKHGNELRPPVSGALLSRVEDAAQCELPEGYRDFLVVHDGGAGPYYGILPLQESVDRLGGNLASLGRDFPLAADVDFGEICGRPARRDDHVARLAADARYGAAFEALKLRYQGFAALPGRLPICDYGCGDFLFVVVRGPRRGTVWVDSVDSSTGLYSLEVGFLELCERWVAHTLGEAPEPARTGQGYPFLRFGRNPRYGA